MYDVAGCTAGLCTWRVYSPRVSQREKRINGDFESCRYCCGIHDSCQLGGSESLGLPC